MLNRLQKVMKDRLGIDMVVEDIKELTQQEAMYSSIRKDFPVSDFSPKFQESRESVFNDFFTRMYLYCGFKLLETIKDSKLDYERSIRTLGSLQMKRIKFGVTYSEGDINLSLDKLIHNEFPWLVNDEFIYDIKGLEFHFTREGEIVFDSHVVLSCGPTLETYDLKIKGKLELGIDKKSGLPWLNFKEFSINGENFPVQKFNAVALKVLELLKDGNLPFKLKGVRIDEGMITLKGEGAQDFLARIFSDPYLFVIFQIRIYDLYAAGVQRLKVMPSDLGDFWRGKRHEKAGQEAGFMGQGGTEFPAKQYKE
jgi:hypothetical protein